MKKQIKSILVMALCLMLVALMVVSCGPKTPETTTEAPGTENQENPVVQATFKQAEYNTTTDVMPSNWNEFTYADNNDTQIMSYIGSSFFDYDYKFENDEKFNADGNV